MWPDLKSGREILRPVRVGVDRRTGRPLIGWPHVEQSMGVIFSTRFHTRVLRRWVGSFVPHILGDNTTERVVGRFYWAIATALDLWEPNYRIQQVNVILSSSGRTLNSPEQIRLGKLEVQHVGVYRPRGHLGDNTPDQRKPVTLLYNKGVWG
jgi:phage baseplate assembly protein W